MVTCATPVPSGTQPRLARPFHIRPPGLSLAFCARAGLGLQPAVELRHVEGHRHEVHVLRKLSRTQNLTPGLNLHHSLHLACATTSMRFPPRTFHPISDKHHPGDTRVRRQQAHHTLRVGGHPGLRGRWLWRELGSGKLPSVKIGYTSVYVIEAELWQLSFPQPAICARRSRTSTTPGAGHAVHERE